MHDCSSGLSNHSLMTLKELPAMRLVPHRQDGTVYYGFADPHVCKCLYVGDADDYARYQKLEGEQAVADSERRARLKCRGRP